ncbi:hypothetical protein BDV19DRAFT_354908 [Aspergillus venezuelensis]
MFRGLSRRCNRLLLHRSRRLRLHFFLRRLWVGSRRWWLRSRRVLRRCVLAFGCRMFPSIPLYLVRWAKDGLDGFLEMFYLSLLRLFCWELDLVIW